MTHEDVRVSEVRQTDDSDKVSEVGHVGQYQGETDDSDKFSEVGHVGQVVGETDDELSEIDDNEISEADMMN